ncbi:MAG: amino acid adenylation domain-containing protein, partial [Isosphaeraceae bacterium]
MSRNRDDRRADPPNLIEMLRQRARDQPDRLAFTFLADGDGNDEVRLTYGELDQRAQSLAARLQGWSLAGERALLLYPPGLEFLTAFFGCLYAGVVAVPAHLPRPNRPMARLGSIVADARPKAVLTSISHLTDAPRWAEAIPDLAGCHTLATDAENDPAALWQRPDVDQTTLAFLQYTSGSTAAPKGVMISHGNLLHNSALIRDAFGSTEDSRGVFWLPLFHDMGLIGGVLQTLFCGGSSTLLSPVAFLQRPLRWLQAISGTGATISGGPNFAYDLCARKIGPEQRATLDLSQWRVAFNGAEPIHPETLERFVEAFGPSGFRREAFLPCYGLAEATLLVSGGPPLTGPSVLTATAEDLGRDRIVAADPQTSGTCSLVGSGQVPADQDVVIVEPESRARRSADQVGEIWVKGPSVAQGYWERPEETERTFHATLADTGDGPFLRTGDLGFLRDGELTVTGRLKDLIIVRGRNVYPQDVEWTVAQSHALLRPEGGAAFSVEVGGEERLVIVHEVERLGKKVNPDEVLSAIRRAVAEQHELDVYAVRLIRALSLPKTSSGKVQRHACRNGFLAETLDVVGSWTRAVEGQAPSLLRSTPVECGPQGPKPSARVIADWLAAKVADPLGLRASEVDRRSPFANFGLGSLQAVRLAGELEEWLERPLSPTLVYDHPTIAALAEFLADEPGVSVTVEGKEANHRDDSEPIAIIGIGCRVPGASGPEAFWGLLRDGVEAVGLVPEDRWDVDQRASSPKRGGFLEQVDQFDADFFGISPREAVRMDPQQRLLLEVAWEALEDAGQVPESLAGKAVGVFIGIATDDYSRIPGSEAHSSDAYTLTGSAASIAANRLSYALDLRGPSLAIDTACSSSLVAAHLACKSLRDGESELALAGGVNLILAPEVSANFAKGGFLAPDGRCKAFDALADGYVRGEGAGIVVLKPLSRALADGDPVYALIRGGAVNQDGRSNGLTAPSRSAQEAVLRAAYRRAGVEPGQIQYVEGHGTGTLLGDPIEANALGTVLAEGRLSGRPCALGSVKTNIGHLEAAAGAVGLIKTALALHHREIPPSLHFHEANPHIPFDRLPLRVATERTAWPESVNPPLAGVSSFGFGGTNAHIVLEGVPQRSNARADHDQAKAQRGVLLPLSAKGPEALRDLARSWRADLAGRLHDVPLADLGYSASNRRGHHDHRLALVAVDADDAVTGLDAYFRDEAHPGLSIGRKPQGRGPGLVFVFTGQGGSWWGVGRELLEREPVARAVFEECDAWFRRQASWSLLDELNAAQTDSRLAKTEVAQPVQFALQVALAALWRSWGIVPDTVIGHSLGEIAAAHLAGVLTLNDALRVVYHRSRLMGKVAGQGGTAALGLGVDEVRRRLNAEALNHRLAIAAVNSPDSTAISGDADALAAFVQRLEAEGIFARVLNVDCAFHGPQMEAIKGELESALKGLEPRGAVIPFVSTVTGRPIDGPSLDAAYWAKNLRQAVLFSTAVEALDVGAHEVFLEVGPHPVLSGAIAACLRHQQRSATILPSLRRGREDRQVLLASLGTLYAQGFAIDWTRIYPEGRYVRLPTYPWQRERFWLEAVDAPLALRNGHAKVGLNGHPAPTIRLGETNPAPLIHEIQWKPAGLSSRAVDASPSRNGRSDHWLIFSDAEGVGEALRERLEARGDACVLVKASPGSHPTDLVIDPTDPEAVHGLIQETLQPARGRCRGVVYLCPLDSSLTDQGTPSDLESAQRIACGGVLSLVQSLADVGGERLPRLWVVTRGAQTTEPTAEGRPSLAQATLWGLGRSFALEYPEFWGGLIDLDPEAEADAKGNEAATLATTIINAGNENQVAVRQGECLVPRLVRNPGLADSSKSLPLRPEGTYLITGGLGDLGLRVARRLVEQGARRLVLLSRSGLPDRDAWEGLPEVDPARHRVEAVQSLERLGATIVTPAVDVADEVGMAALFDQLRRTLPTLRGVVHAAGVVRPRSDRALELDGLLSLFRPKVQGAWILHQLTRGLPLDFFVLFSSVSSVLGARGQADYAAANAFLDAFAHDRAAQGLPAQSINWGPWGGDGMAASSGWLRSLRLMGLNPLDPERGLDALDWLSGSKGRQVTVVDADWSTLKALHTEERGGSFLDEIESQRTEIAGKGRADLRALPVEERKTRVLEILRNRVADVLRLPAERVDVDRPLDTLGLDSLMAMELKAAIEADLGAVLPLSSFLEGPSIAKLADRALADLADPSAQPSATLSASLEPVAESPLSLGQQSLWSAHQVAPQGSAYNISGAARVREDLDLDAFRASLRRLAERHESLRTVFATVNDRPVLRVRDHSEIDLRIEDASAWNDLDLQRRLVEASRRPFDLERGPLVRVVVYRVSDREHVIQLIIHHIITDFWSIAVLMDEFGRFYASERSGVPAALEPIDLRYTDVVRWQGEMVAGAEGDRLWSYWQGQLAGPLPELSLPADRPRPPVWSYRGASRSITLDAGLSQGVAALGDRLGASPYVTLLAAFQVLLSRFSGQNDLIVGSPVSGRTRPGLEGLTGYVINLLPMRANLAGNPTFEEFLGQVRQTVRDGLEHQDFPFGLAIQRLHPDRDPSRTPVFQVMFIYQKAQRLDDQGLTPFALSTAGPTMVLGGLPMESMALDKGTALFDLTLTAALLDGLLRFSLEYNTDLFDSSTIDRLLQHFQTLLAGIVAHSGQGVADLALLSLDDQRQLLGEWSGGPSKAPGETEGIHQRFEAHAKRTPDAIALIYGDQGVTYRTLNERANRLAHFLRGLGVGPDVLVGLCVGRSDEMMVGVLGILKAGGAYVPLDPEYPRDRLEFMIQDAGLSILLTEDRLRSELPEHAARVVCLDTDRDAIAAQPIENLNAPASDTSLAYVIYTSGSTGKPKGVMVGHASLVNAFDAWNEAYHLHPGARHLQAAGFAFDVFTGDWTRALCSGGTLVSCPRELLLDPDALHAFIERERIEFSELVPVVAESLIRSVEAKGETLDTLRLIAVGSDQWRAGQHQRLRKLVGPTARVVNSYGLTEATIDSTYFEGTLDGLAADRSVPIGRPFSGSKVYVLDDRLNPAPIGVPGELCVGGLGLARGYLGRPGLTAERFVPDPFSDRPGARLYRTGDLARWRTDGLLELVGRSDHQVKVRGFRIELGEIEAVLSRHPGIQGAAVVARSLPTGETRLAGYVVAGDEASPEPSEVRRWLKERLPDYMVPSSLMVLDALPVSPNGKVDRRALAALAPVAVETVEVMTEARNPTEALLAQLAAEVLGVKQV